MIALIRQGRLCRGCTNQCNDLGTEAEPIEIDCPSCGGFGCDHCEHGQFRLDGCPNQFCSDMADIAGLIDLFHQGIPPIAGGSLDQSASFIEAARQLKRDEAELKSKRQ